MIGQGAGVVSLGNARKAHGELYWAPVMQKQRILFTAQAIHKSATH